MSDLSRAKLIEWIDKMLSADKTGSVMGSGESRLELWKLKKALEHDEPIPDLSRWPN